MLGPQTRLPARSIFDIDSRSPQTHPPPGRAPSPRPVSVAERPPPSLSVCLLASISIEGVIFLFFLKTVRGIPAGSPPPKHPKRHKQDKLGHCCGDNGDGEGNESGMLEGFGGRGAEGRHLCEAGGEEPRRRWTAARTGSEDRRAGTPPLGGREGQGHEAGRWGRCRARRVPGRRRSEGRHRGREVQRPHHEASHGGGRGYL